MPLFESASRWRGSASRRPDRQRGRDPPIGHNRVMNKVLATPTRPSRRSPMARRSWCGGFGVCGNPGEPARRAARARHAQTSPSSATTPASTTSASGAAQGQPDPQDDCDLRRREPRFERQFLARRARGRARAAGHVLRAHPRRRRRHRRLLHADRLRHGRRRGQGDTRHRRPAPTCSRCRSRPTSRSCARIKGDRLGNLVYRKTARNFNPMMATAAGSRLPKSSTWSSPARSSRTASSRRAFSCGTSLQGATLRAAASRSARCGATQRRWISAIASSPASRGS